MPDQQNDQPDVPRQSTYVFDPESPEELVRLMMMDQLIIRAMGGPLAGLPELPEHANILDVACGPGGWVLDIAYERSDVEVCGVDISRGMIDYANARARSQNLRNASFGVMNVTQPLDFADNSFDLVNARFVTTVLPTDYWPTFLQECKRILRPGGIFRSTESEFWGITNSPACERVRVLGCQLLPATGHGFSVDGQNFGITPVIGHLVQSAGFEQMQQRVHMINYSAGTQAWSEFYHNMEIGNALGMEMVKKIGMPIEPGDDTVGKRALAEMQSKDFCGLYWFLSTWGVKPPA